MNVLLNFLLSSGYLDGAVEAGNTAASKVVQRIQLQSPNFKLAPDTELYKIIHQPLAKFHQIHLKLLVLFLFFVIVLWKLVFS